MKNYFQFHSKVFISDSISLSRSFTRDSDCSFLNFIKKTIWKVKLRTVWEVKLIKKQKKFKNTSKFINEGLK